MSQRLEDVAISASLRRDQRTWRGLEAGHVCGLSRQATLKDGKEARADPELSALHPAKVCVSWPQGEHLAV